MDHADDGDDNDVFVYMGGDQRVPGNVRYVRVHKSVKIIRRYAFEHCRNLVSIEMHDDVEIIKEWPFLCCYALRRIKLSGVRVVGESAFKNCKALEDVEFGVNLDTIGNSAFTGTALRNAKLPKVRAIGPHAFSGCKQLTGVEFSEDLETVGEEALAHCPRLRRIAIPLKENMFGRNVFWKCDDLSQVDLVGGIHKTVSSLLLDSWKNEMNNEIDRINRDLPNVYHHQKTASMQQWMRSVIRRIKHYKSEHYTLLKEFTTLLELALWKAKLDEEFGEALSKEDNTTAKKAKIDMKAARKEKRITSGANVVIKNILPFLKLE